MFPLIFENKSKHCIHIACSIKKTNFVFSLLTELNIKNVSVFVEENDGKLFNKGKKYILLKQTSVDELQKEKDLFKKFFLIYESSVKQCFVDKELEMLEKSKIMIGSGEDNDLFEIFINTLSANISLQQVKQLYRK